MRGLLQAFRRWSEKPPSLLPDYFICPHLFSTPQDLKKPGTGYLMSCPLYTGCTQLRSAKILFATCCQLWWWQPLILFKPRFRICWYFKHLVIGNGPSLFSLFLTSLRCMVSQTSCNVRHQPFTQFNPAILTLCGYFRLGTSLETSTGLEG